MKLYKNVDIVDLKSITAKGILSMKESGNDNWESGRRSHNSEEVVYLFKPVNENLNTFVQYGAALLEVETSATQNEFDECDSNRGKYVEYVTEKVEVSEIKRILIPEIFKDIINPELIEGLNITWCGFECDYWNDDFEVVKADEKFIKLFVETAEVVCAGISPYCTRSQYFRAVNVRVYDVCNVKYIFD